MRLQQNKRRDCEDDNVRNVSINCEHEMKPRNRKKMPHPMASGEGPDDSGDESSTITEQPIFKDVWVHQKQPIISYHWRPETLKPAESDDEEYNSKSHYVFDTIRPNPLVIPNQQEKTLLFGNKCSQNETPSFGIPFTNINSESEDHCKGEPWEKRNPATKSEKLPKKEDLERGCPDGSETLDGIQERREGQQENVTVTTIDLEEIEIVEHNSVSVTPFETECAPASVTSADITEQSLYRQEPDGCEAPVEPPTSPQLLGVTDPRGTEEQNMQISPRQITTAIILYLIICALSTMHPQTYCCGSLGTAVFLTICFIIFDGKSTFEDVAGKSLEDDSRMPETHQKSGTNERGQCGTEMEEIAPTERNLFPIMKRSAAGQNLMVLGEQNVSPPSGLVEDNAETGVPPGHTHQVDNKRTWATHLMTLCLVLLINFIPTEKTTLGTEDEKETKDTRKMATLLGRREKNPGKNENADNMDEQKASTELRGEAEDHTNGTLALKTAEPFDLTSTLSLKITVLACMAEIKKNKDRREYGLQTKHKADHLHNDQLRNVETVYAITSSRITLTPSPAGREKDGCHDGGDGNGSKHDKGGSFRKKQNQSSSPGRSSNGSAEGSATQGSGSGDGGDNNRDDKERRRKINVMDDADAENDDDDEDDANCETKDDDDSATAGRTDAGMEENASSVINLYLPWKERLNETIPQVVPAGSQSYVNSLTGLQAILERHSREISCREGITGNQAAAGFAYLVDQALKSGLELTMNTPWARAKLFTLRLPFAVEGGSILPAHNVEQVQNPVSLSPSKQAIVTTLFKALAMTGGSRSSGETLSFCSLIKEMTGIATVNSVATANPFNALAFMFGSQNIQRQIMTAFSMMTYTSISITLPTEKVVYQMHVHFGSSMRDVFMSWRRRSEATSAVVFRFLLSEVSPRPALNRATQARDVLQITDGIVNINHPANGSTTMSSFQPEPQQLSDDNTNLPGQDSETNLGRRQIADCTIPQKARPNVADRTSITTPPNLHTGAHHTQTGLGSGETRNPGVTENKAIRLVRPRRGETVAQPSYQPVGEPAPATPCHRSSHREQSQIETTGQSEDTNLQPAEETERGGEKTDKLPVQCEEDLRGRTSTVPVPDEEGEQSDLDSGEGGPERRFAVASSQPRPCLTDVPAPARITLMERCTLLAVCEEDAIEYRCTHLEEENRRLRQRYRCRCCRYKMFGILLQPCEHMICHDCFLIQWPFCPVCNILIQRNINIILG